MTAVTALPWGRPLTYADLESMPDDGHRYELIDGLLVVSPAPSLRHQTALVELLQLLELVRPAGLVVLPAPFDVVLADDAAVQPDLLVAQRAAFTAKNLPAAPMLTVEILSPSTRSIDLMVKRSRYEAAGVTSYWVVDPIEPSLLAWDLVDGEYVEVANVRCDETWTATLPYPVTITPSALVAER